MRIAKSGALQGEYLKYIYFGAAVFTVISLLCRGEQRKRPGYPYALVHQ